MKKFVLLSLVLIMSLSSCEKFIKWQYKMKGVAEEGRRDVFEKSRAYNAGKEQDLADYYGQYMLSDEQDKKIIQNTIKLVFADYDESMFKSTELKEFLKKMKYGEVW